MSSDLNNNARLDVGDAQYISTKLYADSSSNNLVLQNYKIDNFDPNIHNPYTIANSLGIINVEDYAGLDTVINPTLLNFDDNTKILTILNDLRHSKDIVNGKHDTYDHVKIFIPPYKIVSSLILTIFSPTSIPFNPQNKPYHVYFVMQKLNNINAFNSNILRILIMFLFYK